MGMIRKKRICVEAVNRRKTKTENIAHKSNTLVEIQERTLFYMVCKGEI